MNTPIFLHVTASIWGRLERIQEIADRKIRIVLNDAILN
jgi:hypothetical protein